MIYDHLKNAQLYFSLGGRIEKALKYLSETNFTNVEPGKYEIEGDNIFALVQAYDTKPLSSGRWEAHKNYIDIQYIILGKEKIGFTESSKVIIIEEYDESTDYAIYKGDGNFLYADEGHFVILFPTDIHMPGIAINIPRPVKKVVVKVKTDTAADNLPDKDNDIQAVEEKEQPLTEDTQQTLG